MGGTKIVLYQDPAQCRRMWETLWPGRVLFDLWPVRWCFHKSYDRPLAFHVAEQAGRPVGMLALSWNEETANFVQFPGETWQNKTWIEQNRVIARTPQILTDLLQAVPGPVHLRHIIRHNRIHGPGLLHPDEIRYLFFPASFGYRFDAYWQSFPCKTRKKLAADLRRLEKGEVCFRHDTISDLEHLFELNINAFGPKAYFSDPRFLRSFELLADFFHKTGLLKMTTVLINGKTAAVDMGVLWKGTYTLLAGGTSPEFPGVAKLINYHHLKWACHQRVKYVDFLCGDFNWKQRFRLVPIPLYEIKTHTFCQGFGTDADEQHIRCA